MDKKLKGMPLRLKTSVDNGDQKTIKEWAEEFDTTVYQIEQTLNKLNQKHGFHRYYPVNGIAGKEGGVIVDVTKKLEWMEQVLDRQQRQFLDPQLLSFASWTDVSITHLRRLLPKIQAHLANEMATLVTLKEKINQR